jgi:nitrite reductase/ring-hydroxylating ferredoxin subunit
LPVHAICRLDELELDTGRSFTVAGHAIGVFRLDDGVYALHDRCTHGNGRLSDGYVDQGLIECPLHAGCFDIRSGRARSAPATIDVRSYPVRVEDGTVLVELPECATPEGN